MPETENVVLTYVNLLIQLTSGLIQSDESKASSIQSDAASTSKKLLEDIYKQIPKKTQLGVNAGNQTEGNQTNQAEGTQPEVNKEDTIGEEGINKEVRKSDSCNVIYKKTNLFNRKPDMKFLQKLEKNITRFNKSFKNLIKTRTTDIESIAENAVKKIGTIQPTPKEGEEKEEINYKKIIKSTLSSITKNVNIVQNNVYLNFFEKFRHDLSELFYWQEFMINLTQNASKASGIKNKIEKIMKKDNLSLIEGFKQINGYVKSQQKNYNEVTLKNKEEINNVRENFKLEKTELKTKINMLEMRENQNRTTSYQKGGAGAVTPNLQENNYDDIYEDMSNRFRQLEDLVKLDDATDASSSMTEQESKIMQEQIKKIMDLIKLSADITDEYQNSVLIAFDNLRKAIRENQDLVNYLEDVDIHEKSCQKKIDKILEYYNNNYSKMDVVINKHFAFLYVFKIIRIGLFFLALFLSSRIFEEMYIKNVFTKNKDPPSLLTFVIIFIAFDFVFCLFIFIVVLLIKYIFYSPNGTFVIDNMFVLKMVIDYVLSTILLLVFSTIICSIIQKKKYFRYKLEGPRAIRACQELLFGVAAIVFLIPFFLIA